MRTNSERIRQLREQHRMSQQQLANAVGVALLTVGKWERGQSNADPENLLKLSQLFSVDPSELGYELPNPVVADTPPQWAIDQHDAVMAELQRIVRMLENRR